MIWTYLKIGIALVQARRAMFNNNKKDLKSMIRNSNELRWLGQVKTGQVSIIERVDEVY
jgi:hypothetical protein